MSDLQLGEKYIFHLQFAAYLWHSCIPSLYLECCLMYISTSPARLRLIFLYFNFVYVLTTPRAMLNHKPGKLYLIVALVHFRPLQRESLQITVVERRYIHECNVGVLYRSQATKHLL